MKRYIQSSNRHFDVFVSLSGTIGRSYTVMALDPDDASEVALLLADEDLTIVSVEKVSEDSFEVAINFGYGSRSVIFNVSAYSKEDARKEALLEASDELYVAEID